MDQPLYRTRLNQDSSVTEEPFSTCNVGIGVEDAEKVFPGLFLGYNEPISEVQS